MPAGYEVGYVFEEIIKFLRCE